MFDLEKFKTGKYYVHLPTQELYDEVIEFLDKNGFTFRDGTKLTKENSWGTYKENTLLICYQEPHQSKAIIFGNVEHIFLMKRSLIPELEELPVNQEKDVVKSIMELFEGENDTGQSPNQPSNEERYTKIMLENKEIYLDKNKKYGDAFAETVKKYGYISALTRMNDKFNRIEQFVIEGFEDEEESLRDSLIDLANYCYMFVMELDNE